MPPHLQGYQFVYEIYRVVDLFFKYFEFQLCPAVSKQTLILVVMYRARENPLFITNPS